ncbi:AsnC family transcriptional regulator [Haloglomus halophilum]|uniref:AsnC family transcriptional regulator n=1 Tax=Haloglomus halophilum TaxID=2962672 RepID=UPI0020C9E989|nr:AsnC family transcriptional regulator [Haloglomus halophilum]
MRDLDDTDRKILRLLLEDARRPYADIAERVDLSPPAVSDRVDRLHELGVIERFTVDIDRSALRDGVQVLVTLRTAPDAVSELRAALADLDGVEHVFETADGRVIASMAAPDGEVRNYLAGALDLDAVEGLTVDLLADAEWTPALGDATIGIDCVQCGNTVTGEGVLSEVGGTQRAFCCESCEAAFRERYEELEQGA